MSALCEARGLTREHPKVWQPQITQALADAGVALVTTIAGVIPSSSANAGISKGLSCRRSNPLLTEGIEKSGAGG